MRFMVMHKMTEEMEKGLPPDPEIIEGVGKLIQDAAQDCVFVSGEGLAPSSQRVHIAYKKGQRTITTGPFSDPRELVAGFTLMKVQSREDAIAWCDRFAAVMGDVELFMGPVVEPWDIGMMPKPENPPLRFLSLHKMDARAEAGLPLDPQVAARMSALLNEMTSAGVLEATGGLASTKRGARIHFQDGKRRVVDGPFTESKELVAGYAILDVTSKAAAVEWAVRFGEVVRVNEVEVREVI
jgi:hypothetical protein